MATVTLSNDRNIVVTSALVSDKLLLTINGQVLGTVIDEWNAVPPPPAVTRLNVANLADGTQISAQWQPYSGGTWTAFTETASGCYYDFPNPPVGAEKEIRFTATAAGVTVDPKFILRTKTSSDE
jgi:hypothetical protein